MWLTIYMTSTTFHRDHCSSCGAEDFDTEDGYTDCCNKSVCYGGSYEGSRYGTPANFKLACCWGKAAPMFGDAGIPEGACRLN